MSNRDRAFNLENDFVYEIIPQKSARKSSGVEQITISLVFSSIREKNLTGNTCTMLTSVWLENGLKLLSGSLIVICYYFSIVIGDCHFYVYSAFQQ